MDKENSISKKYKKDLKLIKKHIKNNYFYKVIFDWGTYKDNKFYKLHSNINIYECIFLHYLILSINKKVKKFINILEIGCAYGTSGMIILNAMNKYKNDPKLTYSVIDPNQHKQWNSVGFYNIDNIDKKNIEKIYVIDNSYSGMKRLYESRKKYNLIFIDGGHEFKIVYSDCRYADKLLKINGIVVLDDCLHEDVSNAIKKFYGNNDNYIQIQLDEKNYTSIKRTDTKPKFNSFINPKTMIAFQKIN